MPTTQNFDIVKELVDHPPRADHPALLYWVGLATGDNDGTAWTMLARVIQSDRVAPKWVELYIEKTRSVWHGLTPGNTRLIFPDFPALWDAGCARKFLMCVDACLATNPKSLIWSEVQPILVKNFIDNLIFEKGAHQAIERVFQSVLSPEFVVDHNFAFNQQEMVVMAYAYSIAQNRPDFIAPFTLSQELDDDSLASVEVISFLPSQSQHILSCSVQHFLDNILFAFDEYYNRDPSFEISPAWGETIITRSPELADLFLALIANSKSSPLSYLSWSAPNDSPLLGVLEKTCYAHGSLQACHWLLSSLSQSQKAIPEGLRERLARLSHMGIEQSLMDEALAPKHRPPPQRKM